MTTFLIDGVVDSVKKDNDQNCYFINSGVVFDLSSYADFVMINVTFAVLQLSTLYNTNMDILYKSILILVYM